MPIVTLTTDLGLNDYYVAAIKGILLSQCKDLQIADISHSIKPQRIEQAAYVLRSSYNYFPQNTIHLICVNNEAYKDSVYLLAQHKGHYFLAADNGIFSLLFDGMPEKTFQLNKTEKKPDTSFAFLDTLLPSACALANGQTVQPLVSPVSSIRQVITMQPSIGDDFIRANVLYIDHFENVILNVTKEQFEKARAGRRFYLSFRRNEVIDRISSGYAGVPDGEKLCLFNSAGYLEIAINHGNAASLLGLDIGESMKIEFK